MLPALGKAHPHDGADARAIARGHFSKKQQEIVDEHRADGAADQDEVYVPHPPVDPVPDVWAAAGSGDGDVNFAGGKLLVCAGVAFSAGLDKVRTVDGGSGVGGRQDFMQAVATAAIRRKPGTVLLGKSVIASKKCADPVLGQVVFRIQAFGRVALAAD